MREIPLTNCPVMVLVDNEDYEPLARFRWRQAMGYALRCSPCLGGWPCSSVKMTQLLLPHPYGMVVDHVDGDPLNNQKANLRICTLGENSRNTPFRRRAQGVRGRFATHDDIRAVLGVPITRAHELTYRKAIKSYAVFGRVMVCWQDLDRYAATLTAPPPTDPAAKG